jgi:hypothetical protein
MARGIQTLKFLMACNNTGGIKYWCPHQHFEIGPVTGKPREFDLPLNSVRKTRSIGAFNTLSKYMFGISTPCRNTYLIFRLGVELFETEIQIFHTDIQIYQMQVGDMHMVRTGPAYNLYGVAGMLVCDTSFVSWSQNKYSFDNCRSPRMSPREEFQQWWWIMCMRTARWTHNFISLEQVRLRNTVTDTKDPTERETMGVRG